MTHSWGGVGTAEMSSRKALSITQAGAPAARPRHLGSVLTNVPGCLLFWTEKNVHSHCTMQSLGAICCSFFLSQGSDLESAVSG